MKLWRIGFAGFGNVNRSLARLLLARRDELLARHGIAFQVNMAATRRYGALVEERGLDVEALLDSGWSGGGDLTAALRDAPIDLLFEGTTLDPVAGEPATAYVRATLERGVSVVSANKGPLAFAAHELLRLARRTGAGFRFESSVADCVPVFDLCEAVVPVGELIAFEGVLNATSNIVLEAVAAGVALDEAVASAQRRGIAEADPSNDLDGWDHAVKAVILSNVLFGADLRPLDVDRTTVAEVDLEWVRAETRAGRTVRMVAAGGRDRRARVEARSLLPGAFLAGLGSGALGLVLETELAGSIQVAGTDPGVEHTAYGMLTDLVAIHQGRRTVPWPLL